MPTKHNPQYMMGRSSLPCGNQVQCLRTVVVRQTNSRGKLEFRVHEKKDVPIGINISYQTLIRHRTYLPEAI